MKVDQVFNLEKSTLQAVQLDQETESGGPLYADSSSSSSSSSSTTSMQNDSQNDGLGERGDAPETVFGDTTTSSEDGGEGNDKTEKSAQQAASIAQETRTGGHSVETAGPLYGK